MSKPDQAIFTSISSASSTCSEITAFYKYSCALHKTYVQN